MSDNQRAVQRIQRKRLIKSLVINLAAIALSVYLLMPAGPISGSAKINLGFLLLPIIGYFVLRLGSAFCLIYFASRTGYAVVCFLRGASVAFFLYWLFDKAVLLTRIPFLAGFHKFFSGLTAIQNFAVLFIFGVTLAAICGLYKTQNNERYWGPLGISLGQIIIAFSLWRSIGYFSLYWQGFEGIALMCLAGMSAVALSTTGILGQKSGNSYIADFCSWLRSSPVGKFFIGAAVAAYLIFIRSVLFENVPYAFLIEWILLCVVVWFIYRAIHNILRSRYTVEPIDLDWQKHVQQIDDLFDEDFNKIGLLQRDFVEFGTRRPLLNYLKQVLINNNLNDDQINQTLISLIEYSDKKIPWYIIWFWRKRKMQNNLEDRMSALQDIIDNLTALAHPVYQRNRSNI